MANKDEMQEVVVDASQRSVLKKPPSAWKVAGIYSLMGGPVAGIIGGLMQRHKNKTFLQEESEARAEKDQLYDFMDSEAKIGDEDERRTIAYARGVVTDGYERLAIGDNSGKQLIAHGRQLLEGILGADMQARKSEEAAGHQMQRDLVSTSAKGMRQEYQDSINAFNAIDHSAHKVLDLVSQKDFDPNKPANKAVLMELLSMGGAMFKDTPDLMDGLAQGVGALNGVAGGIAQGIATMFKSSDFKMTPEDYNRLALNAQKFAKVLADRKMGQLGDQSVRLDSWAKKQGVIPEDYSLGDYVSGGEKELRLTPNPVFTGGYESKSEPSRSFPRAPTPTTTIINQGKAAPLAPTPFQLGPSGYPMRPTN